MSSCALTDYPNIFSTEYGVTPVVAAEIEWYLRPALQISADEEYRELSGADTHPWKSSFADVQEYFQTLSDNCESAGLELHSLNMEDGPGQVEAALMPTSNPQKLADNIIKLKEIAADVALQHNLEADFAAKPYMAEYGSGMHIHVHLRDDDSGQNRFEKRGDNMSDDLRYSLAGLLQTMPEYIDIFAPTDESKKRFAPKYHAPVNASWGGNNRTVALRLPDASGMVSGVEDIAAQAYSHERRIEHRVAGADADPALVLGSILSGIEYGLKHHPDLADPIYGDASDAQYGLNSFLG